MKAILIQQSWQLSPLDANPFAGSWIVCKALKHFSKMQNNKKHGWKSETTQKLSIVWKRRGREKEQ